MEGVRSGAARSSEQLIVPFGEVPVQLGPAGGGQLQVEVQVPVQGVGIVVDTVPLHVLGAMSCRSLTALAEPSQTVAMATASATDDQRVRIDIRPRRAFVVGELGRCV